MVHLAETNQAPPPNQRWKDKLGLEKHGFLA